MMGPSVIANIHERLARLEKAAGLSQWTPPEPPQPISIQRIKQAVCLEYKISQDDLVSGQRVRPILIPRHIAIYLSRAVTGFSYQYIARAFGCRNHATAYHACKKLGQQLRHDPALAERVGAIEMALGL